jgi:hypothetical protein
MRNVSTVREDEARVRFATKAELEKLTVKILREAIRKENGKQKSDADKLKDDMDKNLRKFSDPRSA